MLSHPLGTSVNLAVLVDSKKLFGSLSSQGHPTYKSVLEDANSIRYEYETCVDLFGWISGSCSPADLGTKLNSHIVESFLLTSATGKLKNWAGILLKNGGVFCLQLI